MYEKIRDEHRNPDSSTKKIILADDIQPTKMGQINIKEKDMGEG